MVPQGATEFKLWTPGLLDAIRCLLLSENLQGALQLVVGILFVSLFVFLQALRFPGSCVAVMLYIVVAVTAAPNNHVGTKIFTSGFMIGPMWLALGIGGIVGTLACLSPSHEGHMIILCTLGPLAIIPFAITRVGTSHPALWAMGMVSTLYLGLPILVGFPTRDLGILWQRSVLFILVAALIGMFAGSVFSMIVLPSLASHKVEDEVSAALQQLGHHLSHTASHLFRRPGHHLPLPQHLHNIHPLVLQHKHLGGAPIAPGLLDKDLNHEVSPADVYAAVMDWFEHLSRPPGQQQQQQGRSRAGSVAGLTSFLRNASASSASSTKAKSTFYGPEAAGFAAAAVAAAAEDSLDGWADVCTSTTAAGSVVQHNGPDMSNEKAVRLQDAFDQHVQMRDSPYNLRLSSSVAAASFVATKVKAAVAGGRHTGATAAAAAASKQGGLDNSAPVTNAAVGPDPVCKDTTSSPEPHCKDTSNADPVCKDTSSQSVSKDTRYLPGGLCKATAMQPIPSVQEARQALARAFQLLEAAKAEPQWLRGAGRQFDAIAWAKVIAQTQQLALRLSGLDLVYRDHASLSETSNSFYMGELLEDLLKSIYGTAAAALSLLAAQLSDRGDGWGPTTHRTAAEVLQDPLWRDARERLWHLLEQALLAYWQRLQTATANQPVTLPPAQAVRQWMFCVLATVGVMDALDALTAATAAAAANTPKQSNNSSGIPRKRSAAKLQPQQQHQQPLLDQQQQVLTDNHGATATAIDIEAAPAAAVDTSSTAPVTEVNSSRKGQQQRRVAATQDSSLQADEQQQQQHIGVGSWLKQLVLRNTHWMRPWLPLALNITQFKHLYSTLTLDLPRMFSSKQALVTQLRGRRFLAGVKYWFVCSTVLVAVLALQYYVPISYKYAPNFGYSAAAVGMSDRVESTIYKVFVWVAGSIAGAVLGWALMSTPDMANNAVALAAILCCTALLVGSLGRSRNMLVTFFTLMTVASVVLCQNVGCCGHTGSTEMAIMRGLSVTAAALFSVAVQNLIWPWYTSSWAVEQLGQTYQSAAGVLADLVCQLYQETDDLVHAPVQGLISDSDLGQNSNADSPTAAADVTAKTKQNGAEGGASRRLRLLDEAVGRVQQQLQQQQQSAPQGALVSPAVRLTAAEAPSAQPVSGMPSCTLRGPYSLLGSQVPMFDSQVNGIMAVGGGDVEFVVSSFSGLQMIQGLLQQQNQKQANLGASAGTAAAVAAGAGGGTKSTINDPAQLQAKIMRPLIQVKVSLVLDTTAWTTGPYATPPVVSHLLQCMFDVADALGALQRTLSLPVQQLSGSWCWMMQHTAKLWGQLLAEVLQLAEVTVKHLGHPSNHSADELLRQIQEVQHKRFEFVAVQRDLRRLLHVAMATDEQLRTQQLSDDSTWHLEGQLRYSGCMYATAKVLDRVTAVARCALEVKTRL